MQTILRNRFLSLPASTRFPEASVVLKTITTAMKKLMILSCAVWPHADPKLCKDHPCAGRPANNSNSHQRRPGRRFSARSAGHLQGEH